MDSIAKKFIIPEPHVFRTVFLYVGQGDSTLMAVPDGEKHKFVLIDSHYDESTGGIDIIKLLKDLFKGDDTGLDVYINTHPHKDHLGKVKAIYEEIGIKQLWHSGHKPGGEYKDAYEELEYVIKKLGKDNVFCLKGSKEENKLDDKEIRLGDINYNVLAPAEYVTDEIEDEKPKDRYNRIHEQCGVIRFKYGKNEKQILITGDADYDAWTKHITDVHKDRLPSFVLSAAHHGSNSFFWKGDPKTEEPYTKHIELINPKYIVVSAPKRDESKHDHPDKEAMEQYEKVVGKDKLFHLGEKKECIIVDIKDDGDIDIYPDDELVADYGISIEEDTNKSYKEKNIGIITKVDSKPMGI